MLETTNRRESFGSITYNPHEDTFSLQSEMPKENLLEQKLSAPVTAHWITTMQCNARCPYCYELPHLLKPSDKEDRLSEEETGELLENLAQHEVPRIYLTGGEPTLNPALPDIIRQAYDNGIKSVINSNGIFIPSQVYEAIRDSQARLSLSLDSYKGEEHNKARKQKSFDAIVKTLKTCAEERVDTRVISVMDGQEEQYWQSFARFLEDLGIRSWFIQGKHQEQNDQETNLQEKLQEQHDSLRIRVLPAIFDSFLYILPNGEVGSNLWNEKRRIYGNVKEKSLEDLWQSHPYTKVKDHKGLLSKIKQE